MKLNNFGFSTYVGLGVVIFVALVGALGYTYVMNYKAEVASSENSSRTIAAQMTKAPEIKKTSDLNVATKALDDASVDTLSDDDIASLEAELDNL